MLALPPIRFECHVFSRDSLMITIDTQAQGVWDKWGFTTIIIYIYH